jgi:hypothetical protein
MMEIRRIFEQPNKETFNMPGIRRWMWHHIEAADIIVDPFAGNQQFATYTNDLNPKSKAQYHLHAFDFLAMLKTEGVKADLVLLDPPYSLRQMKEIYNSIGNEIDMRESQRFYGDLRDAVMDICSPNATVISFGWNSIGMTKRRGFKIEKILLVCHGRAHNDTICVLDRRLQTTLW